jgi:hypothetical protein
LLLFDAGFDLVRSRYTLRLCTWHGRVVDAKSPGNLTGEPYVTDGLRLVLFLNEPRQPFNQIDFLDWERVSPWQSPRLQRFNSIDPNADSIMVAFPTGTFLDAA